MSEDKFLELGQSKQSTYSRYFKNKFTVNGEPKGYDMQKYAQDPQGNIVELAGLAKYYYISEGMIMRTVNIIRDYSVTDIKLDYSKGKGKTQAIVDSFLKRIDITKFCKDFMFEMAMTGNCFCYDRDGEYIDIYPLDLIDVSNVIIDGKQQVFYDNSQVEISLENDTDDEKLMSKAYPPEIQKGIKQNRSKIPFDLNNSYFSKMNSSRYDRYGISFLVPAFDDLSRKNLLKEAERSTASGIIDQILHIKVGDKDHIPQEKEVLFYSELFNGKTGSIRVTTPHYVSLEWISPNAEIFGEEKFLEIDKDLLSTLGVSLTLLRGEGGGNYSEGMLNITGLIRTIESIRSFLPPIIEDMLVKELARNGINADKAPKVSFNEIVIDENARLGLVQWLFEHAGLPYKVLFEEHGYDYDYMKLERIDENKSKDDEIFELRNQPFQGNVVEKKEAGRPEKNLSERKSDKSQSNNEQPRSGVKEL
ncbi:hypothetical protein KQI68_07320 [Peptoniphilus sp. MSJ-1]|uniref:Portal protein n=1 Tax=Peptoniphilus ovalis TaxID=2841503 RepID=A0ABS6FI10_9FIRM|nr:hypothetical protein [Peptoniphilus ovalis]MBU5669649.1 hypothetical protein [Peptoniphilus ovalis]